MGLEIPEGTVLDATLHKDGGSWVLVFTPEIRNYLGIRGDEEKALVIKFDKGKHGRFLGIGIKGKH